MESLTADKIAQIYKRFSKGGSLNAAFETRFGAKLDEETLNESHQIIIVAAELDHATERIIQYLNARTTAINVLFFQLFGNQNSVCQPQTPKWRHTVERLKTRFPNYDQQLPPVPDILTQPSSPELK